MGVEGETLQKRGPAAQVRRAILEAATAEIAEAGVERASLRSISRRVGITHQALAYHFPDRRAVLTALALGGFTRLVDASEAAVDRVPAHAPLGERAAAIGTTYVRFARQHPELFTLMLGSSQIDGANSDLVAAQRRMWHLLLGTVTLESEKGWGAPVDPQSLAVMAWTIVHGLATLGDRIPGNAAVGDLLSTLSSALRPAPGV